MRLLANSILEMGYAPEIREPTLTSVVECMRGCGRGCEFCAPNPGRRRISSGKGRKGGKCQYHAQLKSGVAPDRRADALRL